MFTKKFLYAGICYALFVLICINYVKVDISTEQYMSVWARLLYVILMSVLLYSGSYILVKDARNKVRKLWFYGTFLILFIIYVFTVLQLTLLDPEMGRNTTLLFNLRNVFEYLMETANITPFRMMEIYWNGLQNGYLTLEQYVMNMAGNVVIMMPMGFFLPILNKKYAKFGKFLLIVLVMILCIECTQAITMRGYFDVDDIFLNLSGALFMFVILKLPSLQRFMKWLMGE